MIMIEEQTVGEVATSFGVKGVPAEKVAEEACDEAKAYLAAGVPVSTWPTSF